MTRPYADTADAYHDAGWRGILPLPAGAKKPVPAGYSGWQGEFPSYADIITWIDARPDSNIALRLPANVIGIDVDAYDGRHGEATLNSCQAAWGTLPPTWRSTARTDGVSGIRLYTVPEGLDWPGELPGGHVEVVQVGHRYVVCAPSIHPNGDTYEWLWDSGVPVALPAVSDLPALPADWIIGLSRGKHVDEPSADVDAAAWIMGHNGGTMCATMQRATQTALAGMQGSRHEHLIKHLLILVRHGEAGHTGMGEALKAVRDAFLVSVAADKSRTAHEAAAECERALAGAVAKVEGSPTLGANGDPCTVGTEPPNLEPQVRIDWAPQPPALDPLIETVDAFADQYADPGGKEWQELPDPFAATTPRQMAPAAASPVQPATPGRHLQLTSAANIAPRPVFWLWKGRLALGTLGLLAGREGLGKSTLAYWMAARITEGTLYGEFAGKPKSVLVCATEDSWEHTIVPRLMAAGADLTRVFRVEVIADAITVGLSLPRDLIDLELAAKQTDSALLLLDPLMSRLGDLDTHRDSEVRMALEPLVAIADRSNMAILGLIHHNKSGSADPLQLVMGSKAFTAVARSVHTVVPDPDDENRRLFGTAKSNLGTTNLPTFSFTIESHRVPTAEGDAWTSAIVWGEELTESVGDVMQRAVTIGGANGDDKSAVGEASEWLADYLASQGGTSPAADLLKAGRGAGHNESALKRARTKLRISSKGVGFPRVAWWSLAEAQT